MHHRQFAVILQYSDVLQRIAVNDNQIGQCVGFQCADAAVGIGLNGDSPALYFMVGLSTNFGYLR